MTVGAYFASLQVRQIGNKVYREVEEKIERSSEAQDRKSTAFESHVSNLIKEKDKLSRRELSITKKEREMDIRTALKEFEIKNNSARSEQLKEQDARFDEKLKELDARFDEKLKEQDMRNDAKFQLMFKGIQELKSSLKEIREDFLKQ